MSRARFFSIIALLGVAATASAQNVEVDPLQCWWRTSTGAVRMGETFSLVLTCSVLDSDAVRVVPDQGPLEPMAIQLPPFEVVGGTHHADLRADDRRFFQYDYRLRLINEDLFGKDAAVPELKITYRVRSQVNGAGLEGAEKTYLLPSIGVRVLSLVPAGASDIRDSATGTFGDIESSQFRANLLVAAGGVLLALGVLLVLVSIVRAALRHRGQAAVEKTLATDREIIRGVQTELSKIAQAQRGEGWTPALASRLLTALRVAAAFAAGKPPGLRPGAAGIGADAGYVPLSKGWGSDRVVVSGYITPWDLERELVSLRKDPGSPAERLSMLEELQPVLARLTAGQYGRAPSQDEGLDEALEVARRVVGRLKRGQVWPIRTIRAATRATVDLRQRVWSR